jgi:hypothetical protein
MPVFAPEPAGAAPDLYRIQHDSGDIDRRVCPSKTDRSPKVNASDPKELLPPGRLGNYGEPAAARSVLSMPAFASPNATTRRDAVLSGEAGAA